MLIKGSYLDISPKNDDYRWVAKIKKEAKMARIEEREPEEKELTIPPL
jgi:hypothetical protein